MNRPASAAREPLVLLALAGLALVGSGLRPFDRVTWWLEVAPVLIGGEAAESFLGTQGDVWDTQWDMCLALFGALSALLLLARAHDRSMRPLVDERDRLLG